MSLRKRFRSMKLVDEVLQADVEERADEVDAQEVGGIYFIPFLPCE